jgi:NAD(P)-dependent dehydrogenase (short-subunit alcohol dehydrogenase family)
MSRPSFDLAGRAALVTGASSGLGWHFAKVLAAAGAQVAIGARRRDRLESLAAEIRAAGGTALPVDLDVTSAASVHAAFEVAEAALGPVTIVVNNAGVPSGGFLTGVEEAEWRDVMSVNLDGVFRVGKEAALRMQHHGGGAIVNIASILGIGVAKSLVPYAASKAAVIQLTRGMALELARNRIRVNALAPGYVSTEMNSEYLAGPAGQRMLARVPMQRAGEPDDLAGPLLLLVSDAGSYITGSVLTVDGGTLLAMA